jgi:hypothetical protein
MPVDSRSWVTVAVLVAVLLGSLAVGTWRTRRTYAGFSRWILANLLFALSLPLFTLRSAIPDWISVVAANTLVVPASILLLEAIREFRGMPPRFLPAYAAGGLAIVAIVFFDYVVPSVNARISAMSWFFAIISALCCVALFR